jgi:hypothetical protein
MADVPTVFISVEKSIRGRKVKATASIPQSGQDMSTDVDWARRMIGIYLAYEEADWTEEESDLDFWLHPSLRLFPEDVIFNAMPLDVAHSIPFPIQKEFNGYDTTGKTVGQVAEENSGLLEWLAYSLDDYANMLVQVCAARKALDYSGESQEVESYEPSF